MRLLKVRCFRIVLQLFESIDDVEKYGASERFSFFKTILVSCRVKHL